MVPAVGREPFFSFQAFVCAIKTTPLLHLCLRLSFLAPFGHLDSSSKCCQVAPCWVCRSFPSDLQDGPFGLCSLLPSLCIAEKP